MTERYERQMKKGILEILVLKLLETEEKYGYQLISELKEKSDGFFTLKEGTLYPILYRLEEDGFVISRWSVPQGRELSRKYYQITENGVSMLREAAKLWRRFSEKTTVILSDSGEKKSDSNINFSDSEEKGEDR